MQKENGKDVIKQRRHSKLDLESSTQVVSQDKQQAWKTLNQVQGDNTDLHNGGFTLIELLVVVLIIGILAAVALPQYKMAVAKARAANLVTIANTVLQAQERYYLANGVYTKKWDELDVSFSGTVSGSTLTVTGGKINITLILKMSSAPDAVVVKDARLPNMHLYWGYSHTTFLDWAGKRTCYAEENNQTANQLCQHITNRKNRDDKGGDCNIYYFR